MPVEHIIGSICRDLGLAAQALQAAFPGGDSPRDTPGCDDAEAPDSDTG